MIANDCMDITAMLDHRAISRWIVSEGLRGAGEAALLAGFCERSVEGGVPLMRGCVAQRTLHPVYAGDNHM